MELADYEGLFAHSQSIRVRISWIWQKKKC
jgi:hypothetical protein